MRHVCFKYAKKIQLQKLNKLENDKSLHHSEVHHYLCHISKTHVIELSELSAIT